MLDFELPGVIPDEGDGKKLAQVKRRESKEANLRKLAALLDLFGSAFTKYFAIRGIPRVYVPSSQDIALAKVAVRMRYSLSDWKKFINLYFKLLDSLLGEGDEISFKHFLDNFGRIAHLADLPERKGEGWGEV